MRRPAFTAAASPSYGFFCSRAEVGAVAYTDGALDFEAPLGAAFCADTSGMAMSTADTARQSNDVSPRDFKQTPPKRNILQMPRSRTGRTGVSKCETRSHIRRAPLTFAFPSPSL